MSTRARAGKLQVVASYKVVAHQERVSVFGGNGLGKTLLHSERFVARGECGHGRHRFEHAHHVRRGFNEEPLVCSGILQALFSKAELERRGPLA